MKIEKQHIFICGEGKEELQIYLTIDLIPISVIFKYNLTYEKIFTPSITSDKQEIIHFSRKPYFIDKLFTIEVYQRIVDLVCENLHLENRTVICRNEHLEKFRFGIDKSFYEFQFYGNFGRAYFVKTKIHNALKYWNQIEQVSDWYKHIVDFNKCHDLEFHNQLNKVRKYLDQQGVFTRRDYHYISKNTMDNFIKNLNKKS